MESFEQIFWLALRTPHIDKLRALFIEQVTTVREKYEELASLGRPKRNAPRASEG